MAGRFVIAKNGKNTLKCHYRKSSSFLKPAKELAKVTGNSTLT